MKKIIHITEATGGGVLSVVSQLCNHQSQYGNDVYLIYSKRKETPENLRSIFSDKVTLIESSMTRSINPIKDIKSLFELQAAIKKIKPDIIHLHSSKAGFIGRISAWLHGYQNIVFYSPHGLSFLNQEKTILVRIAYLFLERLAYFFGGKIIACSSSESKAITSYISKTQKIVIENAVDTGSIPIHEKDHQTESLSIGSLGRYCFQKNPELFAEIASAFKGKKISWTWIGDEPEDKTMTKSGLVVTGWLDRNTAIGLMSKLDIYVQTSRWEGMPMAVIEAQVCGIPAIVSDVPGNRDVVIHGKTGFIARTADEFIQYIEILSSDHDLMINMGKMARSLSLKRFSSTRMNNEWDDLYSAISKQKNPF